MASRQTWRTPHNVYTQNHADWQFQDFIQYSKLKNLPIPNGLASSSKQSQTIDASKRQKLAPGQVYSISCPFFSPLLMLFVSSLLSIQQAQLQIETKLFSLLTMVWLMTRIQMETNTPHFPPSTRSMLLITIPKVNTISINILMPIILDHPY